RLKRGEHDFLKRLLNGQRMPGAHGNQEVLGGEICAAKLAMQCAQNSRLAHSAAARQDEDVSVRQRTGQGGKGGFLNRAKLQFHVPLLPRGRSGTGPAPQRTLQRSPGVRLASPSRRETDTDYCEWVRAVAWILLIGRLAAAGPALFG